METQTPLERAIRASGDNGAKGTQVTLARKIGVSQQAISIWIQKGGRVPAEYVIKVEAASGVSREELRPDMFAPMQKQASTEAAA